MNDEIKQYLTNYLGDLDYWSGTHSMEDLNHITSGTPTMDSDAQLAAYIKPLEDLLKKEDNELKKYQIDSLRHWEKTFLEGGVDDEQSVFIAGVLAAERRNLERRIEPCNKEPDDEVRILMNVHCLLCLAIFPENSTASTVDTCPNCGNVDKKQIVHLQEQDDEV